MKGLLLGQKSWRGFGPRGLGFSTPIQYRCLKTRIHLQPHRQQSLNVLLQERGHVLPVHDVVQPAVLPVHRLLAARASRVGHVLEGVLKTKSDTQGRCVLEGGGVLALP